jgi:hypothetical protein
VTITGLRGSRSFTLNLGELSSCPSVFATAIRNSKDPVQAIRDLDLQNLGVTIDSEAGISVFQVALYYLKTSRVNTGFWKVIPGRTPSKSGDRDFEFQIRCILLAQKIGATTLVHILALEIRQEWLRFPLNVRQIRLATETGGALDQFLIDWVIQIEYEKDDKVDRTKQHALRQGIQKVEGFRSLLQRYLVANPVVAATDLKFGEFRSFVRQEPRLCVADNGQSPRCSTPSSLRSNHKLKRRAMTIPKQSPTHRQPRSPHDLPLILAL